MVGLGRNHTQKQNKNIKCLKSILPFHKPGGRIGVDLDLTRETGSFPCTSLQAIDSAPNLPRGRSWEVSGKPGGLEGGGAGAHRGPHRGASCGESFMGVVFLFGTGGSPFCWQGLFVFLPLFFF